MERWIIFARFSDIYRNLISRRGRKEHPCYRINFAALRSRVCPPSDATSRSHEKRYRFYVFSRIRIVMTDPATSPINRYNLQIDGRVRFACGEKYIGIIGREGTVCVKMQSIDTFLRE